MNNINFIDNEQFTQIDYEITFTKQKLEKFH